MKPRIRVILALLATTTVLFSMPNMASAAPESDLQNDGDSSLHQSIIDGEVQQGAVDGATLDGLEDPNETQNLNGITPQDPSNDPGMAPKFFKVSGDPNVSVWRNLRLDILSGLRKNGSPYLDVTDRLSFRVSATMTSMRPLISWNCLYSPVGSPPFLDMDTHLDVTLIVNGVQMNTYSSGSFSCNGAGSWNYPTDTSNYAGMRIQIAVRAWTKNLQDDYQTVGAKTAEAICDPIDPYDPGATICRF